MSNAHCKRYQSGEFFAQHKLASRDTQDFDDILCFLILAAAIQPGFFLKHLLIGIVPITFPGASTFEDNLEALLLRKKELEEDDPIPFPGQPNTSNRAKASSFSIDTAAIIRNPIDFSIERSSAIIIALVGQFWNFSGTMGAVSTKHDLGERYHTPSRHRLDGTEVRSVPDSAGILGHGCISFYADRPCRKDFFGSGDHVRHGISFNLDLIMPESGDILPVTFDPDVENKGGNN